MSVKALRSTFGPNCHWCGLPMDFDEPAGRPESATIEHLVDSTFGGVRSSKHRRLAHAACNHARNQFRQQAGSAERSRPLSSTLPSVALSWPETRLK